MYVLLIPAYEPDDRLLDVIDAMSRAVPAGDAPAAVVVVDDGSGRAFTDVFDRARTRGAWVLTHPRNRGKGAALKTGFREIAGRWPTADIVTADADGQHRPDDVAAVARRLREAGRGLVLGVRTFEGPVPARSRWGNGITRVVFRAASGQDLRDTQTGLRGYPAAALPWLASVPGDRFEYEFSMLLRARGAGWDLIEVPIATVYLQGNASSHFRPVADAARIYAPFLRFVLSAMAAFVLDMGLLLLVQALTGWLLLSVVLARVVSAGVNFAVNRSFVFGTVRSLPLRTAAARYFSLAALLLIASYGSLTALLDLGMSLAIAKPVTDIALFAVSFAVQRAVVFAPVPGSAPPLVAPPRQRSETVSPRMLARE
ncbi:glycosyltransferase [Microbacterium sp.]|uniref:glycosyltransferase n=1 Tax=Microbacterium sp. TaxID=51671 RepID=UPI0039E32AD0